MKYIYVDIPVEKIKWSQYQIASGFGIESSIKQVLEVKDVKFVFNRAAGITQGDLYRIEFEDEKDELFFLVKWGFETVDPELIKEIIEKRYPSYGHHQFQLLSLII